MRLVGHETRDARRETRDAELSKSRNRRTAPRKKEMTMKNLICLAATIALLVATGAPAQADSAKSAKPVQMQKAPVLRSTPSIPYQTLTPGLRGSTRALPVIWYWLRVAQLPFAATW